MCFVKDFSDEWCEGLGLTLPGLDPSTIPERMMRFLCATLETNFWHYWSPQFTWLCCSNP